MGRGAREGIGRLKGLNSCAHPRQNPADRQSRHTQTRFMKNMKHLLLPGLLLGISFLFPQAVFGDSFRCGRKVIRNGDTAADLVQKCGEPQSRDSAQEELWLNRTHQKVRVERWHYKQGSSKLARVVLVYRGEVVGVQTGNR